MLLSPKCRIMEQLIYNHTIILGHPLYAASPSTLSEVAEKDYPGEYYFSADIPCIDLDAYEDQMSGESGCTMDAAVGVSKFKDNRVGTPSLALIELRMDYKSVANLDFSKIEGKMRHSRDLLVGNTFHHKDYFVFTSRVAQQAVYEFKRHSSTHPILKIAQPISVEAYNNTIKNWEDCTFEPVHSRQSIYDSLSTPDPDKLSARLDFWIKKMYEYRVKYDLNEAKHILDVLDEFLRALSPFGDFTQEFIDLYKFDVSNGLKSLQ